MRVALPLLVVLLAGAPHALAASGTRVVHHRAPEFMAGELDGLAVDADGALAPAPVSQTRFFTPALYIWSMVLDQEGRLVAGTGDDGGVVREAGESFEEMASFPDELVMAVADADGAILAATGPEGRIYRVVDGADPVVLVDREETTAWTIAPTADGDGWLAGYGPEATLVRFDAEEAGEAELVQSFDASVLRRLVRDGDRLWAITQGPSLIYQSTSDGDRADRLRHDAGEQEIPDVVVDGEGGLWFLTLDPGDPDQMIPPSSRLMHLPAEGSAATVWGGDVALMSLARAADGALLVGEIGASRIHRISPDGRASLYRDFGSGDASALLTDGEVTWVGSSNLGDIFRLAAPSGGQGTFTSAAIATPAAERWGRLWIPADGGGVRFAVRSGIRSEPDASWTEWSGWKKPGDRIEAPLGDYLQYRLRLEDTTVSAVELSWARRNHAPRIGAVRLEGDGGDDWSDSGSSGRNGPRGAASAAVVRGNATVRVDAIDPDDDALRCTIEVRRLPRGDWYPLGGDPARLQTDWDTTQFVDGTYEARATVSDAQEREPGLSAMLGSAPVVVDNTPPRLREAGVDGDRLKVRVEDEGSRIVSVAVRRTGEDEFRRIDPVDGVTDGTVEEFSIVPPADGEALWLRVRDAAGNETVVSPRLDD